MATAAERAASTLDFLRTQQTLASACLKETLRDLQVGDEPDPIVETAVLLGSSLTWAGNRTKNIACGRTGCAEACRLVIEVEDMEAQGLTNIERGILDRSRISSIDPAQDPETWGGIGCREGIDISEIA